jgi:hypothetical protein
VHCKNIEKEGYIKKEGKRRRKKEKVMHTNSTCSTIIPRILFQIISNYLSEEVPEGITMAG